MSKWIKCSDRMPDDMSDVLVTDGIDVGFMWCAGDEWDSWDKRYALDSDDITHWMPLPEPPTE
ncbi:DUF551 domain-containing protein [Salmonella enterica]|nr:DUF551 domain-containing protein [Salmonella enterica subsp. enterica]EDQ9876441.1 DUF551 domain-containing protein [Salmonella enterica subsp. enterica]ELR1491004.1 DUF551 domain-containing protein [Salmonella enterica]